MNTENIFIPGLLYRKSRMRAWEEVRIIDNLISRGVEIKFSNSGDNTNAPECRVMKCRLICGMRDAI